MTTPRTLNATTLALALFGLGAGPAYAFAADRGVLILGLGVAFCFACTGAIDLARHAWRLLGPAAERRWVLLAPVLRMGLGLGGMLVIGVARPGGLTLDDLEAMVLVVGLAYPAFLVGTSIRLADDVQLWARQEARLA